MSEARETFANDRVAHTSLRGTRDAPRFSDGSPRRVTVPVANLYRAPDGRALERQLLLGEAFTVLDTTGARCFGRAEASGYVGHVAAEDLGEPAAPTHRVAVRATLGFAAPDLKTPAPLALSLGSQLCVSGTEGRFAKCDGGVYVPLQHLVPLAQTASDPVAVAELLLGTPYLWGGNSAFGIDCSGLVQISLRACGLACPGDSDQQARSVGHSLAQGAALARGDLLFWKGHVAWVADPDRLLHATGHFMAVVYEPVADALARISEPLIAHKRL